MEPSGVDRVSNLSPETRAAKNRPGAALYRLSAVNPMVESALVSHPSVAEAAVVGRPDELTGTAIVAFVTPRRGVAASNPFKQELRNHVVKQIGGIAKPADVRFTDALPKTRSGKIMRRLLRDIASNKETIGDTTTLEDYSVIAKLRESEEA